ncbi:enoyl-CoA hydratase [Baekduia soli]|uniref:Enoyl-CoA hydratase n=1 Tax=Baekduia soli TaxID=496014 RepID=A0A5B8U290_9ACTN|nr:enoyl-CoA hydratase [Baekduia soli]QEC47060.1 enoyl-CoA hydratase [Baekduia soli]
MVLETATHGRALLVTLNRPQQRNALSAELLAALHATLRAADADDAVDVVVVTGADPAFCGGVDTGELARTGVMPEYTSPLPVIGKPLIGAVNGAAVTGGLELAMMCDLLVASERARFADTHARLGFLPGWGQSARLPRAVGDRRAAEMLLTGRFVEAPEALAIGLVNAVVPHDELLDRALAMAAAISDCGQAAVRATVALMREGAGLPLAEALALERTAALRFQGEGLDTSRLPGG